MHKTLAYRYMYVLRIYTVGVTYYNPSKVYTYIITNHRVTITARWTPTRIDRRWHYFQTVTRNVISRKYKNIFNYQIQYCAKVMQTIIDEYREYRDTCILAIFKTWFYLKQRYITRSIVLLLGEISRRFARYRFLPAIYRFRFAIYHSSFVIYCFRFAIYFVSALRYIIFA